MQTKIFFSLLITTSVGCADAVELGNTGDSGTGDSGFALDGWSDGSSSGCAHSVITTFTDPGPDGVWGTADDVSNGSSAIDFIGGRPVAAIDSDANHTPQNRGVWTYDGQNHIQRITTFTAGPDGILGTPDDVTIEVALLDVDTTGLYTRERDSYGAGLDGVWGTSDDVFHGGVFFIHANGRLAWALLSSDAGPDGDWGTADDTFWASDRYEYDAKGRWSGMWYNSQPGPDGIFGTADDVVSAHSVYPCPSADRVIDEEYSSPGPDGVWETADDTLNNRTVETGDLCLSSSCDQIVPY